MVTYRNILFCTDFSDSAQAAVPFAIDLARRYGAVLHVFHVYQEAGHIAEFELSSADERTDSVQIVHFAGTEMGVKFNDLCEVIATELGSCRHKLVRGKPHVEIVRYAKEAEIDVIVMSSHGLSGLEHALFGSTAEKVLRESPCNVLVVRRGLGKRVSD